MNQSKLPAHNIGEEGNVGFFNYELEFEGRNVESTSQKVILNKSSDLVDKKANVVFCKFWTEAIKIKELKFKWSEKMARIQKKVSQKRIS